MYAANSYSHARKINPYLINDLTNASPAQLIMKVYDFAILNCQKHNMLKTNEALQVLIDNLNFTDEPAKEISLGLMRLYLYCQEQMRKENYDAVYKTLTELRDTWRLALQTRK